MQTLNQTNNHCGEVELSWKAKLSIYQSVYVPTLIYGRELWALTKRI